MIKSIIKLAIVLILGVLIYNYFLGTPTEKQHSKKIFGEMKDVAVGIVDLVKTEKNKFDQGKYDKAVDDIGDLLTRLKSNAQDFDEKYLGRIEELEKQRKELQQDLSDYEAEQPRADRETPGDDSRKIGIDSSKIKRDLDRLIKETQSLLEEIDSN